MTPEQQQNLVAQALTRKLKPAPVDPGTYRLRGTVNVEVDCFVTKGDKISYKPTSHLPWKAILALALDKAGIQKRNIAKIVREAAKEALEAGDQVKLPEATARALASIEQEVLETLPAQTKEGSTRVEGFVTVGDFQGEAVAITSPAAAVDCPPAPASTP